MLRKKLTLSFRYYSTKPNVKVVNGVKFETDSLTNITPGILTYLNRKIYNQKYHPLCFLQERITQFFYDRFKGKRGNPIFSVYNDLSPVVSVEQNFDSLLVAPDHPSRSKNDCYYLNKQWMLRAHMTAHQAKLLNMGLNNFLMIGDVYRRDTIDKTHFPVFHQLDGVRTFTPEELLINEDDGFKSLSIKEKEGVRTNDKQEVYSLAASKMVETDLKGTLEDLIKSLFDEKIEYKWVEAVFPFTHPSWELEILLKDKWIEILGCGIMENAILEKAGCGDRIGWAFGIGLERLAMLYYTIPDIRIFWSNDSGFLHQFENKTCVDKITFKPFSKNPACPYDISFWINDNFQSNDFYEWAREIWGNIIEQINLIDVYKCKKTGRESRCYRIVYRSMTKTFSKKELNVIHDTLVKELVKKFMVEVR